MPDWLPQLDGAWQLVFSAPNKAIPAWSYIPVNEDAVFDAKCGITSLASDLGPFHFDFIGDFSWDEACQVLTPDKGPVSAYVPLWQTCSMVVSDCCPAISVALEACLGTVAQDENRPELTWHGLPGHGVWLHQAAPGRLWPPRA